MKKIFNILAAVPLLGIMLSCTDILDTNPYNQLSSGTMWTTEESVDQGVNGVYYSLRNPFYGKQIIGSPEMVGYYGWDAFGMGGQARNAMLNLFTKSVNPSNEYFLTIWKRLYDGVHRANDAIAGISRSPVNAEKKARLLAECKVLRAFFYERLNILYGNNGVGVPLYTEPVTPEECNKGQSTEAEVWKQIVKDLTEAIDEPNLPNNQIGGEGRVSRGFAYALRGRAYLIMKEYNLAVQDFEQVGKCGYKLFKGSYKDLFKIANEQCEEMIFSVQNIEDPIGYGSSLQHYLGAYTQGAQDGGGCWSNLQVTPALVNLYEVVNEDGSVKPFVWEDFLTDWKTVVERETKEGHTKYRKVFFLRDKLVNGKEVHSSVTTAINNILKDFPADIQALYLPEGNEQRIKTAYAHRDPRLAYNVVTPYSNYLGVNNTSTAEGWYTYRYPVVGKYYFNQPSAEPNLNKDLPDDYYTSGCCDQNTHFKYLHRKFVGEGLEFQHRDDNPIDEPIIRYADVLLMWAEALVELNDLPGAMSKVKEVRDRVGMPTMAASFADPETARKYVRDERRREFVNEGVDFFDEMRWRTLKETKFAEKCGQYVWGGIENTGGTTYEWIGDQWYTWPVPKSEIELNHNLKPTPGWEY